MGSYVFLKSYIMAPEDDSLLSAENKERCIEEFKQQVPIREPRNPKSHAAVLIPIIELEKGQSLFKIQISELFLKINF